MAVVNLKRLARDLEQAQGEVKVLALTTVQNLNRYTVENHHDLYQIYTLLDGLSKQTDADIVYMARKGMTNVRNIIEEVGLTPPQSSPSATAAAAAGPSRQEILAGMEVEQDVGALARLIRKLKSYTDEEALTAAAKMTRHKEPRVRASAVEVIGQLEDQRRMLLTLLPLLLDSDQRVRSGVAHALHQIGSPKLMGHFTEMLAAERRQVREAAVWALGHLKGEDKIELLMRALKDSADPIRIRAMRGLANHQARVAAPHLQQLATEVDANVSEEAKRALLVLLGRLRPPESLIDLEALAAQWAPEPELEPAAAPPEPEVQLSDRDKAQEEVKRLEKMLQGGTKMARLDLAGKSAEELAAMQDQHHRTVGQLMVELYRSGKPPHPDLKENYFDYLKYQDMLVKKKAAMENEAKSAGWLDGLKKLALKQDDTQTKLQNKVASILASLGKCSLPLMERGEIVIPGRDEYLRRQKAIEVAIGGTKGRTGNS